MITKQDLTAIMPFARAQDINQFLQPLNDAMEKYEINTPLRISAFLAQVAHESGQLKYTLEIASGAAYEGRKDLGNTHAGDGVRFKGRGLIQITGRTNYEKLSKEIGIDFISNPALLEGPVYASLSAAWFWNTKNLNRLADAKNFLLITKRINGGYNGQIERNEFYERAKETMNA